MIPCREEAAFFSGGAVPPRTCFLIARSYELGARSFTGVSGRVIASVILEVFI